MKSKGNRQKKQLPCTKSDFCLFFLTTEIHFKGDSGGGGGKNNPRFCQDHTVKHK